MKFKIGDKVKFLNDTGEGIVTKIVSESLVNVEIEDGFEVPTLASELVVIQQTELTDSSEGITGIESKDLNEKIEEEVNSVFNKEADEYVIGNDEPNIVFALVPDLQGNSFIEALELFIINDCNYKALYTFSKLDDDKNKHIDAGILEANTKINVLRIEHKDFRKEIQFNIQVIFYTVRTYDNVNPLVTGIVLDPLQLVDLSSYIENDYFDEKAFVMKLKENPLKSELEKISKNELKEMAGEKDEPAKNQGEKVKKPDIEEVDLHIEEIVDDHVGLDNSEILEIQMSRFKISLEGAIRNNVRRVIFIHGVGNGTLRYELRKYIDNNYPKLKYQDASFKEYGYGATMVIIK